MPKTAKTAKTRPVRQKPGKIVKAIEDHIERTRRRKNLAARKRRADAKNQPPTTAIAIRAPVGLLPPASADVPSLILPAAGALTLPEQPIIALAGLSTLVTTIDEREALLADFPPEKIDIKPTQECYVSHIHLRVRLSMVLGVGAWGMQPMGQAVPIGGEFIVMPWGLYIRGHALSWCWGGARYQPKNKRSSWSDALETTKSDALARLCKDIPMASQVWDRRHNDRFIDGHCVLVYVRTDDGTVTWWRTLDRRPFRDETGCHPESPNVDAYTPPLRLAPESPKASGGSKASRGAAPEAGRTDATGPRVVSTPQAKRLMAIATEVGWTKTELHHFLQTECKLKPAEGKADDAWHLCAVVPRRDYDGIIDAIQAGVE